MDLERFDLGNGKFIWAHPKEKCQSEHCTIHNPSNHKMKDWPLNWRTDRYMMERVCTHGIGHPDPDHMAFIRDKRGDEYANVEGIHGCDGCCHD
jgi:hypothetical protein